MTSDTPTNTATFRDWPHRERLTRARAGDDTEAAPTPRELAHALAMVLLEIGLDVQTEGELDRLTCRARRRNDDHAASRRIRL